MDWGLGGRCCETGEMKAANEARIIVKISFLFLRIVYEKLFARTILRWGIFWSLGLWRSLVDIANHQRGFIAGHCWFFRHFPFLSCLKERHLEDGILFSVLINYHYAAEGKASMLTISTHLSHMPRPCKFGANSSLIRHVHTHR